jgi:hypothetical protein
MWLKKNVCNMIECNTWSDEHFYDVYASASVMLKAFIFWDGSIILSNLTQTAKLKLKVIADTMCILWNHIGSKSMYCMSHYCDIMYTSSIYHTGYSI